MGRRTALIPIPAIILLFASCVAGQVASVTAEEATVKNNEVCYIEPSPELKARLSAEEWKVLVEAGTEPPFQNAFWNNHERGLYVDRIDGSPLFASSTKFDSGTGWPSFWQPIDEGLLILVEDTNFGMVRTEVRSRSSGGHLGHVFNDGPGPSGLRYCINSASLSFIAEAEMQAKGYGAYLTLVQGTPAP